MVPHAGNPRTWGTEAAGSGAEGHSQLRGEFQASLGYRVSSRTARAVIQRNPVSKNQKKKEEEN